MKKNLLVTLIVVMVAAFVAMPVMAMGLHQTGELTDPVQLYVIGVIASAIVYAVKLISEKFPQINISRAWLTVILYVIALGLSATWGGVVLPSFGACTEPLSCVSSGLNYVSALLLALAPAAAFATLIYNVFLQKVFDATAAQVVKRVGAKG
jgi:hypothetical protein